MLIERALAHKAQICKGAARRNLRTPVPARPIVDPAARGVSHSPMRRTAALVLLAAGAAAQGARGVPVTSLTVGMAASADNCE